MHIPAAQSVRQDRPAAWPSHVVETVDVVVGTNTADAWAGMPGDPVMPDVGAASKRQETPVTEAEMQGAHESNLAAVGVALFALICHDRSGRARLRVARPR
jgi:hypothetical protein